MDQSHHDAVAGLTPEQWHERLESAADDSEQLAHALRDLEDEISREDSWLHLNPAPDSLLSGVLSFFGGSDRDLSKLSHRIRSEIHRERRLKDRFRSWGPDENWRDLVFPYVKDFPGEIHPDRGGVQFPGFLKYQGLVWNRKPETYALFVNERFPGRDPANFHVQFDPGSREMIIKRVYRMELPRIEGITTPARAVLKEMITELVPDLTVVAKLVVDNAANIATRQALIRSRAGAEGAQYETIDGADVSATPVGRMLFKLAQELGMTPGAFECRALPFGMLRIELSVRV